MSFPLNMHVMTFAQVNGCLDRKVTKIYQNKFPLNYLIRRQVRSDQSTVITVYSSCTTRHCYTDMYTENYPKSARIDRNGTSFALFLALTYSCVLRLVRIQEITLLGINLVSTNLPRAKGRAYPLRFVVI